MSLQGKGIITAWLTLKTRLVKRWPIAKAVY